jgi:hypothetical protein
MTFCDRCSTGEIGEHRLDALAAEVPVVFVAFEGALSAGFDLLDVFGGFGAEEGVFLRRWR